MIPQTFEVFDHSCILITCFDSNFVLAFVKHIQILMDYGNSASTVSMWLKETPVQFKLPMFNSSVGIIP